MLKQFIVYVLCFLLVNQMAYPVDARAAAANQSGAQGSSSDKFFHVVPGKALVMDAGHNTQLGGAQFQSNNGQQTPIVWSNNFAENQGYIIGDTFQNLARSAERNRARNQILANQYQQAFAERVAKVKADTKAAQQVSEEKAQRLLRREVGEFQGLLYAALKTVTEATQVAGTPIKGQVGGVPTATESPVRRGYIDPTFSLQLQKKLEASGKWLANWTRDTNEVAAMVQRYQENSIVYLADKDSANQYKLESLPKLQQYGHKYDGIIRSLGKRLNLSVEETFNLLRSSQLPPDLVFAEAFFSIPESERDSRMEDQVKSIFAKFKKDLAEKQSEAKRIEQEKSRTVVSADSFRTLRRQKAKEERKERAKNPGQKVAEQKEEPKQEPAAKPLAERAAEIGLTPAQVKRQQLALSSLLGSLRRSIQNYSEYTGEKVEGSLAQAVKQVTDLQWDVEKRPQARLFLETLQEAMKTGGGFFQMMEYEQQVRHEGAELRGKFNLVRDLHNDLVRYQLQAKSAGQVLKESGSLTRFARDTFLFSIAIGAVMAQQLWLDYGANPVSMLQHLESMKDPLGNVSFYAFIIANGVSKHLLDLNATSKAGHQARLKAMRLIPYISMTAGSLASNIMSDAGQLFKACVWGIYFNKQEKTDPFTLSACDEALRTLTVTGKINQYVPTVMSMLLSNKVAAVIETEIRGGISKAVDIGSKFAHGSDSNIKIPTKAWTPNPSLGHEINTVRLAIDAAATTAAESVLNRGADAAKGILKFMGAQIGLRFGPHGVAVTGVQMIMMVIQFTAFTWLDHLIMPNIMLMWASTKVAQYDLPNLSRRMETTAKFAALQGFLKDEIPKDFRQRTKWDTKDIPLADCEIGRAKNCDKLDELVLDWRDHHAKWRADQNARFEQAFVGWGEALKNVTQQYATAKEYYAEFLIRVSRDIKNQNDVDTGKTTPENVKNIAFYLNRPTPLYGVTHKYSLLKTDEEKKKENDSNPFGFELDDDEPKTPEEIEARAWKEQFLMPNLMQGFQHEAVNRSIEEFDKTVDLAKIATSSDRNRYIRIRDALKSQDVNVVAQGLVELRKATLNNDGAPKPKSAQYANDNNRMLDIDFGRKLYDYYKSLGEPTPILTPGMAYPYLFAKMPLFKKDVANYTIPLHGSGYAFEKATDYLTWRMLCGEDQFRVHQTVGFAAHFMPPSITAVKEKLSQPFCMQSADVPWTFRYMQKYKLANGEEVNGLMTYLVRNVRPELLGNPLTDSLDVKKFKDWWEKETLKPMEDFYRQKTLEWTPMYRELVIRLKHKLGPNQNNFVSTYFKGLGFIAGSIIAPLVVAVDYMVGVESRWDWYSPYDKSYGDAFKSFLRSFNLNEAASENLIADLAQELSVYNTLLLGLVASDAKNERDEAFRQRSEEQNRKIIDDAIGVLQKQPLDDGSFESGLVDRSGDRVDPSKVELPKAEQKPDLMGIVVAFIQQIEKNIDHLARVQVTPAGAISGQPTRSEMRAYMKDFDEIHMIVKNVLPKYMRNDYQKRLLTNLLIGYNSALNDLQKYRMAANLTNYDRNEDRKDTEEEQNLLNKLRQAQPTARPRTGANPRATN